MWAVGFDLSLVAPAAVALPINWRPGDWKRVRAWLGEPPEVATDDLQGHVQRLLAIGHWAASVCAQVRPVKVAFVEAYGYFKNNAHSSRVMESGGHVKAEVYRQCKVVLQPVGTSSARKLTFGFVPQRPQYDAKTFVAEALAGFGVPSTWGENEKDAYIVAQAALSSVGGRILTLAGEPTGKKRKRK